MIIKIINCQILSLYSSLKSLTDHVAVGNLGRSYNLPEAHLFTLKAG